MFGMEMSMFDQVRPPVESWLFNLEGDVVKQLKK